MLTELMKVAYEQKEKRANQEAVHALLKQFPSEELYKLATGEVTKEAFLDSGPLDGPKTWIDRFKGSPFFEQAVALEQEEIQLEMDELSKRQQKDQERDAVWSLRDQLRLKKRLLELQAAQADVSGQAPSPAPPPQEAQGAGALGQEAPNPEKTVTASALVSMADSMGRELAQSDFKTKEASQRLLQTGDEAGRVLSKLALDMSALKGLGQGAMGFLKANRGAAIGAGVGAIGGLAHGLQKDQNGQRHLLRGLAEGAAGGVAGAAAGHGVEHFAKAMGHNGGNVGEALNATGRQLKFQGEKAMGAVKGALGGAPGAAPAAAGTVNPMGKTVPMAATSGQLNPTINSPVPMNLKKPAPMGDRIPTGMINGQYFQ